MFGLFVIIFGFFMLATHIQYTRQRLRCKTAVEARIVDYPADRDEDNYPVYKLRVCYTENGKEHLVVPLNSPMKTSRNIEALSVQHPLDSTLTVYIDPAHPENAYICPEISPLENAVSLAFVCLPLFWGFFLLLSTFSY